MAARGLAAAVQQRLHALVNKSLEDAEVRELWFKPGAEVQKWGQVVRDAKVVIE